MCMKKNEVQFIVSNCAKAVIDIGKNTLFLISTLDKLPSDFRSNMRELLYKCDAIDMETFCREYLPTSYIITPRPYFNTSSVQVMTNLREEEEARREAARLEIKRCETARLEEAQREASRLDTQKREAARREEERRELVRLNEERRKQAHREAQAAAIEAERIRLVKETPRTPEQIELMREVHRTTDNVLRERAIQEAEAKKRRRK